jgi:uncharacterized protein (TIGR03083 family)
LVAVSRHVGADQWDRPALGVWTVRDLLGHASRALLTVETYLGKPAAAADLAGPVGYFEAVAGVDAGDVAQRGRQAGQALGDEPARAVTEIAERVLAVLPEHPDDSLVTTPAGGMRLLDYLPTRTFELVVHTLDLARAVGVDASVTVTALASAAQLAVDVAVRRGHGQDVCLALTGRASLPDGFSIV